MRTLALLAALLLLALQAQAKPLTETAEEVPAQDLPEAADQVQPGAKGQDMTISLGGADHLTRGTSRHRRYAGCYCTWRSSCPRGQKFSAICPVYSDRTMIRCCYDMVRV